MTWVDQPLVELVPSYVYKNNNGTVTSYYGVAKNVARARAIFEDYKRSQAAKSAREGEK
jgi:hypothetical protein